MTKKQRKAQNREKIFRCEVDLYRNGSIFRGPNEKLYNRKTKGVYYVCARNRELAKNILQSAIGFGSICVLTGPIPDDLPTMRLGEIYRFEWGDTPQKYTHDIPHATDPLAAE